MDLPVSRPRHPKRRQGTEGDPFGDRGLRGAHVCGAWGQSIGAWGQGLFAHGKHWVDRLDNARPLIVIAAESENGFRDRMIPMTPDFAGMLRAVPESRRRGRVFRWPLGRAGHESESEFTVGRRISEAGKTAGVIVNQNRDGTPKFASAHDFRRAFGARWARKVMPIVLKELM